MLKTPPIQSMSDAFSVRGKNVVVTGGNRGIGLGISRAFAESGANVAILCRDADSGANAAASLAAETGARVKAFACDIADNASVLAAASDVQAFLGGADVLVNNAGVATTTPFLDPSGLDEWHRVIGTNLHGTANVIHAFAPGMRDAGRGGAIINISSVGGQRVSNSREHHNAPYNASKAGLDVFTKYLAIILGDDGIRVNAIAPGPTHSDLDRDLPQSALDQIETALPTHRFGEPIEIGALCVFLASPAACQISGIVIPHDGGLMTIT